MRRAVLALALALVSAAAPAQDAAPADPLRAEAERAFADGDHERSAELHRRLVERAPTDDATAARDWYRLGYSLHARGELEQALSAHVRAAELAPESEARVRRLAPYNAACALARLGRADEAFAWLRRAVAAGLRDAALLQRDEDLASLRADERFRELVRELEADLRVVAVVVHDGVELLDFAGPAEVFSAARHPDGGAAYRVLLVAPTSAPIRLGKMTGRVVPDASIADCPPPDIVLVPGGDTDVLLEDEAFLGWVRGVAPQAELLMSVCTGAFVYAELGLLDGREATTHHSALAGLRREHPEVRVLEGVRFTRDGPLLTTAGISAGIDGALEVVRDQLGEDAARAVARYMEYEGGSSGAPAAR